MAQAAEKKPREIEADWDRKATQSAIAAAKNVCTEKSGINSRSAIGSLNDIEWGWIAAASVFGWIKTKAQQAVEEGCGYDAAIRAMAHRDPAPWESGAVETILPKLGDLENVDWAKPVGEWSKDQIISFSWQIYRLTNAALAARDDGAVDKITRTLASQDTMERENSAANGGPLLSQSEAYPPPRFVSSDMNDDIPF